MSAQVVSGTTGGELETFDSLDLFKDTIVESRLARSVTSA